MDNLEKFARSKTASIVLPIAATILLFVVWEILVFLFKIPPYNLPAPSAIIAATFTQSKALIENTGQTLFTTLAGFILAIVAGVVLGFLIGYSRIAYIVLYPLLVGFNTVPKVALVPLFALWFGIGTVPAILTAFLLAFFPIAVNVALGLDTVEPEMKDVMPLRCIPNRNFPKSRVPPHLTLRFCIPKSSNFPRLCRRCNFGNSSIQQRPRLLNCHREF